MSDPIGIAALAKVNALAATVAGMSAGSSYPTVANFAGLPTATGNSGVIYVVQSATGVWLINRKEAGLYRSNGTTWIYLGSDVSTTSVSIGGTTVTADPLILEAGTNITLTPDQDNNKVIITGRDSYTKTESNANYAPIAKGVTNGDTHDHNGGDGAQISYNNLGDKPTIPSAQVNSDWNASSGVAQILNKPTIPTIPATGIAFCLLGTIADNAESARYIIKSAKTATEVTVVSSTAPSSAITIKLYKNAAVELASFSHTNTSTTNDMVDASLVSGDILYAKISGAANGVTNITIEVTIT